MGYYAKCTDNVQYPGMWRKENDTNTYIKHTEASALKIKGEGVP